MWCISSAGEPISTTQRTGKKNSLTIEHILPINFSESSVHPNSDYISTSRLVWRLGNLTLLERVSNSKLQDNSFSLLTEKNYRNSHIKNTT